MSMCTSCGCETRGALRRWTDVTRGLRASDARLARANRHWFTARSLLALNVTGSPGAGKTTLMEEVTARLMGVLPVSVLEGGPAWERDAARLARVGAAVVQIETERGIPLDATIVAHGVRALLPAKRGLLFIDNPAELDRWAQLDLGEGARVLVSSLATGENEPELYPQAYQAADLLVFTKLDLAARRGVSVQRSMDYARSVHPGLEMLCVSAHSGQGIDAFCAWLLLRAARMSSESSSGSPAWPL